MSATLEILMHSDISCKIWFRTELSCEIRSRIRIQVLDFGWLTGVVRKTQEVEFKVTESFPPLNGVNP